MTAFIILCPPGKLATAALAVAIAKALGQLGDVEVTAVREDTDRTDDMGIILVPVPERTP